MNGNENRTLSAEIAGDPELRSEVEREWFADSVIVQIERKMEEMGLTRKELARRMGCSAANVSQLLRHGRTNLTLDTLMDMALAMEHRFRAPALEPLSVSAPWETCHFQTVAIERPEGWNGTIETAGAEYSVSVSVSVPCMRLGSGRETEGIPKVSSYMPHESGEIYAS